MEHDVKDNNGEEMIDVEEDEEMEGSCHRDLVTTIPEDGNLLEILESKKIIDK